MVFERVRVSEQVVGKPLGRDRWPVGFDASLRDVAIQQVLASGIAELSDLFQ